MASPRVLLLVTGGIAAYKACFLARLLVQAGFCVKVAMTEAATHFVSPLTFQVLTGQSVATDLWGEGQTEALDHIEYARWADLVVVAPATANTLAKAAHGLADNMVSTLLLAFSGPVLIAPAMNDKMWKHPATQVNRKTLAGRGVAFVGPGAGFLACGSVDEGRMAEPEDILASVREMVAGLSLDYQDGIETDNGFWVGKKVAITAGPTHERIDPVRYLANRSTGTMGYALAVAAAEAGAQVTLISGPTNLADPRGMDGIVHVESAKEMADAVAESLTSGVDWLIMCAAVADFAPVNLSANKLKKEDLGNSWTLEMERNPDILAEVVPRHRSDNLKTVGFALETENVQVRAESKRRKKGLNYIIANNPTAEGSGFGISDHQVALFGDDGFNWSSESLPKSLLARLLLDKIAGVEIGRDS